MPRSTGARVLVDCGAAPLRVRAWIGLNFAWVIALMVALAFVLPSPMPAALITSAVLMAALGVWMPRPVHTLISETGISSSAGSAKWGEIIEWDLHAGGSALTVLARSNLLMLDALPLAVPVYKNADTALVPLRERVPKGRVSP